MEKEKKATGRMTLVGITFDFQLLTVSRGREETQAQTAIAIERYVVLVVLYIMTMFCNRINVL
jgi:hypothetical protein